MIRSKKVNIKKRIKSDKVIYGIIGCFLICTLLILNPYIIKATSIENTVENIPELPPISSNLYELTTDTNSIHNQLYSVKGLSADLKTKSFSNVKNDDEYTIKYQVNLPDLLQGVMGKYDEVVIVMDCSNHMYGQKWEKVRDFFINDFAKSLGSRDIKIGFVAFEGAEIIQPNMGNENNADFNSLFDMNNDEDINKIINIFNGNYIIPFQHRGNRSIDTALKKASELLSEGFSQNKNQATIIITSGSFNIWTKQDVDNFIKQQHDVITVDIHDGTELPGEYSAAEVHQMLNGEASNFLTADMNSDIDVTSKLSQAIKSVSTVPFAQSVSSRQTEQSNLSHIKVNQFDEVVLAIDASANMYTKKWDAVKDFFKHYFEYSTLLDNLKLGIIPYENSVISPEGDYKDAFNSLLDVGKKENVSKIRDIFGQNYLYALQYNYQHQIVPVLDAAKQLFTDVSNEKAIIFLTSGDYHSYNDTELDNFKKLGYRVITISISDNQSSDQGNAKEIHTKLGGVDEDYITADVSNSPTVLETLCDLFEVYKIDDEIPSGSDISQYLDVSLNFNLGDYIEGGEGLELVEGNQYKYTIDNISYSLDNGRYIFDPIDIEFKIKIKDTTSHFTFEFANISYQYRQSKPILKTIPMPEFTKIIFPNINAELVDFNPNPASLDNEVNITYKITADSFDFSKTNNELKEIVILLDATANGGFYNNFFSKAINGISLYNFLENHNIKLGLVIYGDGGKILSQSEGLTTDIDSIKNQILNLTKYNGKPNLDSPLAVADSILSEGTSKNKNIIIVSYNDVTYSEKNLQPLVQKYKIFTMDPNKDSKLKELHYFLVKQNNGYIQYNGNGNVDYGLEQLLPQLTDELVNSFEINDAKLVFDLEDLEDNFEFVENGANVITSLDERKVLEVPVETIRYELKTVNEKKQYVANSDLTVSFRVKPLVIGDLTFTENETDNIVNYISYSDLNARNVKKSVETPIIKVLEEIQPSKINQHGLYTNHSVINFIQELQENDSFSVIKSMNYTFGMTMEIQSSKDVSIEIPKQTKNSDIELDQSNIYLYELNEDESINRTSKLKVPTSCISTDEETYKINNHNNDLKLESGKKYLLTYSINLKDNNQWSNLSSSFEFLGTVDETYKDIQLEIKDDVDLPDLF